MRSYDFPFFLDKGTVLSLIHLKMEKAFLTGFVPNNSTKRGHLKSSISLEECFLFPIELGFVPDSWGKYFPVP